MKKLLSLLSLVGVMALAGCCGPCAKKTTRKQSCGEKKDCQSKMVKKSHGHVAKKSPAKTPAKGSVKSEVDKLWKDVKNI